MRVNKESKTSEVSCTDINVLDNIKNEIVSNYEAYNNIEVQTSEKPKSESCVGNIEEFSKTAEVLTSGIPISVLLKNQNQEVQRNKFNKTMIHNKERVKNQKGELRI